MSSFNPEAGCGLQCVYQVAMQAVMSIPHFSSMETDTQERPFMLAPLMCARRACRNDLVLDPEVGCGVQSLIYQFVTVQRRVCNAKMRG